MTKWKRETLKAALESKDWQIVCTRELPHGVQFTLEEDVKIDLYNTGKWKMGGPESEFRSEVNDFVDAGPNGAVSEEGKSPDAQRVFVVYGHDTNARDEIELILRRVKANPIILESIPGKGDTLIEKLESLTEADFACVLLTPDDIGGTARCKPDDFRPRARQNVVLELGMVLSRLGRSRVAILVKGEEIEKPSDINGLIYIPFNQSVKEAVNDLAATLQEAGFSIDVRDLQGL